MVFRSLPVVSLAQKKIGWQLHFCFTFSLSSIAVVFFKWPFLLVIIGISYQWKLFKLFHSKCETEVRY